MSNESPKSQKYTKKQPRTSRTNTRGHWLIYNNNTISSTIYTLKS